MPERRPAEDPTAPAPALQLRLPGGFAVVVDGQLVAERAWVPAQGAARREAARPRAGLAGCRSTMSSTPPGPISTLTLPAAPAIRRSIASRRAVDPARRGQG
ncbi:MAG: hypothetical protein U0841_18760 [Chloroflexia bacterium]